MFVLSLKMLQAHSHKIQLRVGVLQRLDDCVQLLVPKLPGQVREQQDATRPKPLFASVIENLMIYTLWMK